MIKLTREDNSWLKCMWISKTSTNDKKLRAIEVLSKRKDISSDRKLAVTQAILDGEWEVEEPLYYVHLLSGEEGYLNISKHSDFEGISTKYEGVIYKTKFTRAEVKAIDPRYLEFLEEVE